MIYIEGNTILENIKHNVINAEKANHTFNLPVATKGNWKSKTLNHLKKKKKT